MNALFNRWLPCLTLASWSAVLLVFYANGRVNSVLAPPFRPLVLIAGIVLALMALIFLLTRADASCCSSAECGHSLSRLASGRILTFAVLILPLTTAATYSPRSFSKTTIENLGITDDYSKLGLSNRKVGPPPDLTLPSSSPAPANTNGDTASVPPPTTTTPDPNSQPPPSEPATTDYLTRTPEGLIVAEVLDLLYAAQDNVLRKDFEGKDVQLIGQLMPDPASPADGARKRFKAVRMFMYCCAADSRPIATLVETDALPEMPEMTWIKVTGKPSFPLENGRRVSVLQASKVEKTEPPEEAMLY